MHLVTALQQSFSQMRANESRSTSYQDLHRLYLVSYWDCAKGCGSPEGTAPAPKLVSSLYRCSISPRRRSLDILTVTKARPSFPISSRNSGLSIKKRSALANASASPLGAVTPWSQTVNP